MPVITLLNGRTIVYKNMISLVRVAEDIKVGLSNIAVGAIVNKKFVNINILISKDSNVYILTMNDAQTIHLIRYSCIQLLSYVCKEIFHNVKIASSGIIHDGFYCDLDVNYSLTQANLLHLETCMREKITKQYDIIYNTIEKNKLYNWFKSQNEIYKLDYINNNFIYDRLIPVYYHQDYLDIYLGPQASNIKFCSYFKLQNISGAYWKGNKSNKMLQRIYGQVWLSHNHMLNFFNTLQNSKDKDHRLINKKMRLYHIQDDSPGMVFWHHNGLIIFNELKNFLRRQLKQWQYEEVKTPIIMNESMWRVSGHIDNFFDSIFYTFSENQKYCIKPMNCPAHIQIFNYSLKSYRDLPIRMAEFGICHRNETSGSLHGLLRLKNFTQDDAHIFCTRDQVQTEITNCIRMILHIYKVFGFQKIHVKFSTRPKNRIGNDMLWDQAESDLKRALLNNNIIFQYQVGEGAFYGPKIEFILEDCLNRLWQCGTIQLDFYLPGRFGACYIDCFNNKQVPIMIHRAIFGSIERFLGILLEQYSGFLPIWLCPIQVIVISINNTHSSYVLQIHKKLFNLGIRVQYDIKNEKINFKIRKYIIERIPYILICGDKEVSSNQVSVRIRNNSIIQVIDIDFFIKTIQNKIHTYSF